MRWVVQGQLGAAELKIESKYPGSNSSVLVLLSKSTENTKYQIKDFQKCVLITEIDDSF